MSPTADENAVRTFGATGHPPVLLLHPWWGSTPVEGGFRGAGSDVQICRYHGSGHWFAERGSPGFDEPAFELARSRVTEGLRMVGR